MHMKKFAVILSGCGVYDGSEIHEAVMALWAIDKAGARYEVFAPDRMQVHVINHRTGKEMNEQRNVLTEAARIARGKIAPLSELDLSRFDALVLPGGYGAAKNLSSYAFEGTEMQVIPELEEVLTRARELGKPIGAMCISPVILAKVFGNVKLTIGTDQQTAAHLEQLGASHEPKEGGQVAIDTENKIVTTPCYMVNTNLVHIAEGAEHMVAAMLGLM